MQLLEQGDQDMAQYAGCPIARSPALSLRPKKQQSGKAEV